MDIITTPAKENDISLSEEIRFYLIKQISISVLMSGDCFLVVTLMACFTLNVGAAGTTIWQKAEEIMKDVYNKILAISTIAAIVTAAFKKRICTIKIEVIL